MSTGTLDHTIDRFMRIDVIIQIAGLGSETSSTYLTLISERFGGW
jgi:hypothetical protein